MPKRDKIWAVRIHVNRLNTSHNCIETCGSEMLSKVLRRESDDDDDDDDDDDEDDDDDDDEEEEEGGQPRSQVCSRLFVNLLYITWLGWSFTPSPLHTSCVGSYYDDTL